MTKAELAEAIFNKVPGLTKKEAADTVDVVFNTMKDILSGGESIKITAFGNFVVRNKASRKGRNPQTGQEIEISARRVLTFKPSQVLKDVLNKDQAD